MHAEILAVGTELLMGQIANTNAQYLSSRFPEVGIGVYHHSVVGDNPKRLKESLEIALSRSDIVVMTGGLGPTQDDLTKETVAEYFNKKLVLHEESLEKMKCFFEKHHRNMTPNNEKQAYLPEGSMIITNKNGTAPGCILEENGKIVILLPGPPFEMKPMFEETVLPYFAKSASFKLVSKFLRIFGIGESAMESQIIDLIENQTNPTIAPYAKQGEVTLRITAQYASDSMEQDLITPVIQEIKNRLGHYVYSTEGQDLDVVVGELLMQKGMTFALAESCTGGLLTAMLTAIPGISCVLDRSIVTYSNQSKIEMLDVDPATLEAHGAVSAETAKEMARGIRKLSKTQLGIAITGIAGPDGGTEEKPVGLVYVALSDDKQTQCKQLNLWGDRTRIRNSACLHTLDLMRRHLLELNEDNT